MSKTLWSDWHFGHYGDARTCYFDNNKNDFGRVYVRYATVHSYSLGTSEKIIIEFSARLHKVKAHLIFESIYPLEYEKEEMDLAKQNVNNFISKFDELVLFS